MINFLITSNGTMLIDINFNVKTFERAFYFFTSTRYTILECLGTVFFRVDSNKIKFGAS